MAFNVGAVVAEIKADISNFSKGIQQAQKEAQGFGSKLSGVGSIVSDFAQKASALSAVAGASLVYFFKGASDEASNFEKSMITLDIIAGKFGVSSADAKKSAEELGKSLRIGVGASAEGLQNLLKGGLNLDQAKELMKRFTNEAITGKSANISLSDAVKNLTFAYTTNNSALGNMSGINENFQDIIEKGRNALVKEGKALQDITEDQAKYRGMMDLTNLTLGSAERFTGTFIDKQAQLSVKITELKVAIGEKLNPVLASFIGFITESGLIEGIQSAAVSFFHWLESLKPVGEWIVANKDIVLTFLKGLALGLGAILVIAPLVVLAMSPFILLFTTITVAVAALYTAWKTNFWGIRDVITLVVENVLWAFRGLKQGLSEVLTIVNAMWSSIKNAFNAGVSLLRSVGSSIITAITQPFITAYDKVKSLVNKIKDALDFTKRHSPSVVDIVQTGVGKVNSALEKLSVPLPEIKASMGFDSTSTSSINHISVDMKGAYIGSEALAKDYGEMIGDNIIKKLQLNVRF